MNVARTTCLDLSGHMATGTGNDQFEIGCPLVHFCSDSISVSRATLGALREFGS